MSKQEERKKAVDQGLFHMMKLVEDSQKRTDERLSFYDSQFNEAAKKAAEFPPGEERRAWATIRDIMGTRAMMLTNERVYLNLFMVVLLRIAIQAQQIGSLESRIKRHRIQKKELQKLKNLQETHSKGFRLLKRLIKQRQDFQEKIPLNIT